MNKIIIWSILHNDMWNKEVLEILQNCEIQWCDATDKDAVELALSKLDKFGYIVLPFKQYMELLKKGT